MLGTFRTAVYLTFVVRKMACMATVFAMALGFATAAIIPAKAQEPGQAGVAPPRDLSQIITERRLRVAFTSFDVPGFRKKLPDGSYAGPEADLAKSLAKALGVDLVYVDGGTTFNQLARTVADLKADIGINRMSASYDRVAYVRFSQPYAKLRHALVYNRDAVSRLAKGGKPEDAIRSFSGRVGAIAASSYVEFAMANFPRAKIVEVKSWDAGIKALRDKTIDVLYRDEFEVRRVLERNPDMGIDFGTAILSDKVDLKVVYICNTCGNLEQFVNLYIENNRELLARSMSVEALLKNAREK